jgi:hypothetical protein
MCLLLFVVVGVVVMEVTAIVEARLQFCHFCVSDVSQRHSQKMSQLT